MKARGLVPITLLAITAVSAQDPVRIELVPWAEGLPHIVDIAHCGDDRLFAVCQDGYIRIVVDSMVVLPAPFLDIHDSVLYAGEQGLLGLAFDPDYASNGYFYVNYVCGTGGTHSRISRFSVTADPDSADPASEHIIYSVPQPNVNHKGGDLDFGPDGMLYVAFGDGGGQGDPLNNAQDLSDPLGDIIRIDVSDPDTTFTVPIDNPHVGAGPDTLPEIWASGLRNPFRFGFDRLTGDLWLGDVGQSSWEEIDRWPAGDNSGPNFGWRCYEGFSPFNTLGCADPATYVPPVTVHVNDGMLTEWCAIIGGRVYRGTQWPHFQGRYFYTDFCHGDFWTLKPIGGGQWLDQFSLDTTYGWTCIAEDLAGELFTCHLDLGIMYKIIDGCPMDPPAITYDSLLTSTPANGYQWYLDSLPIPGATDATYLPAVNGNYFVLADLGDGCLLHSDTVLVMNVGLVDMTIPSFALVPDPADDHVAVSWGREARVQEVRVVDLMGRTILGMQVRDVITVELTTDRIAAGNYLMELRSQGATVVARRFVIMH